MIIDSTVLYVGYGGYCNISITMKGLAVGLIVSIGTIVTVLV